MTLADALPISWCGSPAPRRLTNIPGLAVEDCAIAEIYSEDQPRLITRARIVVLDAAGFSSLDELRATYHTLACPVLVLAPAESAHDVLRWLSPGDDLALSESPIELLVHRIRQLHAGRTRALDSLTGLPQRRQLVEALERLLPLASEVHPLALVMVDIDHFKRLNDSHGHLAGDRVIRELGAIVGGAAPHAEELARYAGEVFAFVLSADDQHSTETAERLRAAIAEHVFPDDIRITASVGVACVRQTIKVQDLLQHAQEAVYAAKASGRDRVVAYSDLEREAAARDEDVALASFENLTRVVSERVAEMLNRRGRQLFERLREEADNDALTGLHARRYLDRRLAHETAVASAEDRRLTIALIDIDHFGDVNKDHGWPSGDKVLRELAELLGQNVRATDWLARYGGEEFCLVMPQTGLVEAQQVVERLREEIADQPFASTSGDPISLTISVGVVQLDQGKGEQLAPLLERVSERLLQAKRGGRNRVCG